tara:strand:- start:266 stop:529 length:264 start_codon:yes stop_codon:yes gene_type:complete
MEKEKYEILYIPICLSSSLPKTGWIQSCINCGHFTSKFIDFKEINCISKKKIFQIIICKDCSKPFKKDLKLQKKIYEYANDFINLYQ